VNRWRIIGGPRQYAHSAIGLGIDVGWVWTIQARGNERQVRVEVAAGDLRSVELASESFQAIETQGRIAVENHLAEVQPPILIRVTRCGVFPARDAPGYRARVAP
jgi:hypothetical protein